MDKYNFQQKATVIQQLLNDIPEKVGQMLNVTHAELVALRDAGTLQAGRHYRITDYVTTTNSDADSMTGEAMVRSAGHPFDVIVLATSANTISETARAILHGGDEYFAGQNLQAWQLWYTLDNDKTRFAWADTANGKGVIYRMIDEYRNDLPYDFKNIQFRRYTASGKVGYDQWATGRMRAMLSYYQQLLDNEAYDGPSAVLAHPFCNYEREADLAAEDNTYQGYTLSTTGTRMFAVINNAEEAHIIVEVSRTTGLQWYYTFTAVKNYGDGADLSLSGRVTDVVLGAVSPTTLPATIFIGSEFSNISIRKTSRCTFGPMRNMEIGIMRKTLIVAAHDSTITTADDSTFGAVYGSTVNGSSFGTSAIAHLQDTIFNASTFSDSFISKMVSCSVTGSFTYAGIDMETWFCQLTGCQVYNSDLTNSGGYKVYNTEFIGMYNGATYDFTNDLDEADAMYVVFGQGTIINTRLRRDDF